MHVTRSEDIVPKSVLATKISKIVGFIVPNSIKILSKYLVEYQLFLWILYIQPASLEGVISVFNGTVFFITWGFFLLRVPIPFYKYEQSQRNIFSK